MRRVLVTLLLVVGALALTPASTAQDAPEGGPGVALAVADIQTGLDHPWGLTFAPDGTMFFTERGGGWYSLQPPYTGTPTEVQWNDSGLFVQGETGLLDIEV